MEDENPEPKRPELIIIKIVTEEKHFMSEEEYKEAYDNWYSPKKSTKEIEKKTICKNKKK